MSFSIDRQTLDELNLLGKFRQGSVYHLFSQVKTSGGEQLLENMFRHPMDDASAINERSSVILLLQNANLVFPFDVYQISLMREYIDKKAGKNAALTLLNITVKKILSGLTRDERYKKNVQGLQAATVTLNKCHSFINAMPPINGYYAE